MNPPLRPHKVVLDFVRAQAGGKTNKRKQSTMNIKTRMVLLITATFALSVIPVVFARAGQQPDERMWETISERSLDQAARRLIVPMAYHTVRLDKAALTGLLASAPMEFTRHASRNPIIRLPMPDGTLARFRFEESPVVEPALAAQYPGLKTYRAQGIDDPTATTRFDWLPNGFHAMIVAASGTVFIDPYAEGNTTDYITYWKKDLASPAQSFACQLNEADFRQTTKGNSPMPDIASDEKLRTYRLALAATHEYAVSVGGTIAATIAAEVLMINRVNVPYERDLAIHINIIGDNAKITYANDQSCGGVPCTNTNDPYTNSDCAQMLPENRDNLRAVIGVANYDVGHVFSTCNSGLAALGSVCGAWGGDKEFGSTGQADPLITPYTTYYVAHEIGHQFTANHSFNGIWSSNCTEDRRSELSAFEPGSGITFMGYNGGCGPQNLDGFNNFIDIFTVKGLEDIITFIHTDATCGVVTNTGNIPPPVTGPGNFSIPKQTPFSLTATSSKRGVTYDWEEYDLGPSTDEVPNSDEDDHARPIFRLYAPTGWGTRYFPSLPYVLNNANVPPDSFNCGLADPCLTGERLPWATRVMVFKVVVRDNSAGGGAISTAESHVTINGKAFPFVVTSPNTHISIPRLTNFNVTWVASGNAANVKISLSTDGGTSFSTVLAASTPNDGAQSVFIPDMQTTTARIKIEAVGNIYFDISDSNFSIVKLSDD